MAPESRATRQGSEITPRERVNPPKERLFVVGSYVVRYNSEAGDWQPPGIRGVHKSGRCGEIIATVKVYPKSRATVQGTEITPGGSGNNPN